MNTSIESVPKAVELWFTDDMLYVRLDDGREVGTPLEWFPKLRNATDQQRNNWRFIGKGVGIHWEELDEDLSVRGLIR
ncbi:MAG TPA: DUF2442 domain-containing protein [Saprospiraceae bacterium]|nr:DUF2442 domain-containing protein [Candidatus Opimibacter skivensis]HQW01691.1 DUF2442 domain-containing protein [Saprospiraceae bacterium]HQW24622.1 DUF2442 domain-containing protein [Saprospiraceae bacterium]